MKNTEWVYDILWAPPQVLKVDAEFIGWVHAQYAMKIAEINAMREERERIERIELKQYTRSTPMYRRYTPIWKKLIGVF